MPVRRSLGRVCLFALFSWTVYANTTGTIVGRVTDPSGRVVPDAKVAIRNVDTNVERHLVTGPNGEYSALLLPPGSYAIEIEKTGFQRCSESVKVDVNETIRVDAELAIGQVIETLVVNEQATPLQQDTSSRAQLIDRQKVIDLPLNERNFLSFALLAPGAQMPADGSQNSTQGAAVTVNGAREQANSYTLDGIDNNDQSINFYSSLPSVDAIQEFQLQTGNASAEFGRSSGAQVNILVRSGTNDLHGTAFEFVRNRHLDAKNFFDKPGCTAGSLPGTCGDIPRLDRNQFGGSVGGPIVRDKTFFFLSYEGLGQRQAYTREATVPSQVQRDAALAAVPPAMRNPSGVATLNLYPAANVGADLQTSNTYVASPVLRNTINQFLVKVNHSITSNDLLSGVYSLFDEDRFNPYDPFFAFTNLPGYGSYSRNRGQTAGLAWTHVFGPRMVNDARLGFTRLRADIIQESDGVNHNAELGYPTILNDQ